MSRPVKVAPATLLPRPDAQTRAALAALRSLYRDHLDQRGLDLRPDQSVDQRSTGTEAA